MICVGNLFEVKSKMEDIIENRFPRRLSLPYIVKAANEYERLLNSK